MEEKEKVENKENCCENMANCSHCMYGCHHHHGMRCHVMKKIIMIILIIIAFCLGSQWGEMRSGFRENYRFDRGGMMDWGYNRVNTQSLKGSSATGTVTVDVSKNTTTPEAPKQ